VNIVGGKGIWVGA